MSLAVLTGTQRLLVRSFSSVHVSVKLVHRSNLRSSDGDSEELIGKWFKRTSYSLSLSCVRNHGLNVINRPIFYSGTGLRNKIFLATKFGFTANFSSIRGDPEFIAGELATSLKRLQTDHIDLYYVHRTDPKTPIETTVEALASYVK